MGFELNKQAMIVRVPVEAGIGDLESFLARHGFTLGAFQPPVGTDPRLTLADWLSDPLIPPCNWAGGNLLERIVSITAEGKGGRLVTNMAPRSATGPDLNHLVSSTSGTLARIREAWLRVRTAPVKCSEAVYRFDRFEHALKALAALAHRKAYLESAHLVSKGGFHTLVLVHDEGTELGRARARFADSIARAAGGSHAEAGVSIEWKDPEPSASAGGFAPPERGGGSGGKLSEASPETTAGASFVVKVEALPSSSAHVRSALGSGGARARGVEIYAPYAGSAALEKASGEMAILGARCCVLYRYGIEGCSFVFVFDAGADADAARGSPATAEMAVRVGGAFLTNGGSPVVEGIFQRIGKGLKAAG